MIEINAQDVLNYIVSRSLATEEHPLKLGNVEFWFPIPGYPVGLCYSIHTCRWDAKAVQDDINKITADYWSEMCECLQSGGTPIFPKTELPNTIRGENIMKNWEIKIYETAYHDMRCTIVSPGGSYAECELIGVDGRLSKYRTKANINFRNLSDNRRNLRLSESMVDRLIVACKTFARANSPDFDENLV